MDKEKTSVKSNKSIDSKKEKSQEKKSNDKNDKKSNDKNEKTTVKNPDKLDIAKGQSTSKVKNDVKLDSNSHIVDLKDVGDKLSEIGSSMSKSEKNLQDQCECCFEKKSTIFCNQCSKIFCSKCDKQIHEIPLNKQHNR